MEYALYILAGFIGLVGFRLGWLRYPHKISKWKRNRMSDIEFFEDRLAYSLAICIVLGGFVAYCVYTYYNNV